MESRVSAMGLGGSENDKDIEVHTTRMILRVEIDGSEVGSFEPDLSDTHEILLERACYCASRHVTPLTMLSIVVRLTPSFLASQARDVPGTLISLRMSMT